MTSRSYPERLFFRSFALGALLICLPDPTWADAEPAATLARTYTYPGGSLHVSLTLQSVRGPAFEVFEHQGGGTYTPFAPSRPARTYLGTVLQRPGAIAAGQVLDDGSMRTTIVFEDGTTWRGTGSAVTLPSPASWTPGYPTLLVGSGGAGSNVRAAEVGVDLTNTYYNQAGQSSGTALERAEWSIIQANAIYLRDAALFHRIGRVIVRIAPDDDRSTSLSLLKSEWETVLPVDLPGSNHDLALTVQTLGSSGLAWIGSVGTSNRYAWVSIRGSSTDGDFSTVWRHEVGHNWGCGHSEGGVPEGPTVMSGNGLSRFSSADLARIVSHRDSRVPGLLDALGPWPSPLPPRANADRGRALISGAPLALDVLDNDSDSNGDAITLRSFDTTSHLGGTVARVAASGPGGRDRLSYTPPASFTSGIDWLTYRIEDAAGLQSVAFVMIQAAPQGPDISVVADVSSVANGEWTNPETWSNATAADAGHHYAVRTGTTVDSPVASGLTFPGDSLQIAKGGVLRLRHTSAGGNTSQTVDLKSLILADGAALQSYNTAAGNVVRTLSSPLAVPAGRATIRIQSDSGSAYTNSLILDGGLFGGGDIDLTGSLQGQSGERRILRVDAPAAAFSGNWSVAGDNTSDTTRRLCLTANGAGALGSGLVRLGPFSQLRGAAAGALDSLAGVTLDSVTATLDLLEPWTNPSAILVINGGTLILGSGHSHIGDLRLEGVSVDPGKYTAASLTELGGAATFSGTGMLSVGLYPPDAVSVDDGPWTSASIWSHALPAPTTGTQGEGLIYLVEKQTVSSNDPASNSQALVGAMLRIADDGTLDLVRSHSTTNQNVSYSLPDVAVEDGGTVRFRATTGSCTHHLSNTLSFQGSTSMVISGGSYSNNVNVSGRLNGSGVIALVSDTGAATVGNVRTLTVLSPDNTFAGDWTVAHTASGDDFVALRSLAARALGTGRVGLGTRARLINAHPQGLDSLSVINLTSDTSALILNEPLYNPAATLTMNGSTLDLGNAQSAVGTLIVGNTSVSPGIYDADDLNLLGLQGVFVGNGYLTVIGTHPHHAAAYADWICSHPAVGTPADRNPGSDPDADGLANMVEYVLDTEPDSADLSNLPVAAKSGANMTFTFTRLKAAVAAGFTADVEYSETMAGIWTTATAGMYGTPMDHGATETVTVTIPIPNGASRFFARLRVGEP
ncbi:MAG: hypothetical protein J0M04_21035 [Verrucomicrobia bacterium]|nr:hypothetical protein [Verrucomicrobiota bacterium]